MRNLLLHIAYNGSRYHGYQVQQNAVSVAGTFQPVLEKILAEKVQLKGCSRTDTGVHANDFAMSFKTNCRIPCAGLVKALNNDLPPDMAALRCEEVDEEFHAGTAAPASAMSIKSATARSAAPLSRTRCGYTISTPLMPRPFTRRLRGSSEPTTIRPSAAPAAVWRIPCAPFTTSRSAGRGRWWSSR